MGFHAGKHVLSPPFWQVHLTEHLRQGCLSPFLAAAPDLNPHLNPDPPGKIKITIRIRNQKPPPKKALRHHASKSIKPWLGSTPARRRRIFWPTSRPFSPRMMRPSAGTVSSRA